MAKKQSHLVFIVDDDTDCNALVALSLKKLNIISESFVTASDFLKRLKDKKPTLCLVDLNIGTPGIGFSVIKAVRSVLGPDLPLLIISSKSDTRSIAHAMELGANDYIIKPVDLETLASKLSNYILSEDLITHSLPYFSVPDGGSPATIDFEIEVLEVDELGMRFRCPHLLSKGTLIEIPKPLARELSGTAKPVYVTVTSTDAIPARSDFLAYAEFDLTNEDLLRAIRKWLVDKASQSEVIF